MRSLNRNKSIIYYANREVEGFDRFGNKVLNYSEPKPLKISVSAGKGESINDVFGQNIDYDKILVTTDTKCHLNEYSHLWLENDVSKPHNYVVKAVYKSMNQIRYAIKRVTNQNG